LHGFNFAQLLSTVDGNLRMVWVPKSVLMHETMKTPSKKLNLTYEFREISRKQYDELTLLLDMNFELLFVVGTTA